MIHNEHLRSASETYEVRHDDNGNAIHVRIDKYGNARVYPTLDNLIRHVYLGERDVKYFDIEEKDLYHLYTYTSYNFYQLRKEWIKYVEQFKSNKS